MIEDAHPPGTIDRLFKEAQDSCTLNQPELSLSVKTMSQQEDAYYWSLVKQMRPGFYLKCAKKGWFLEYCNNRITAYFDTPEAVLMDYYSPGLAISHDGNISAKGASKTELALAANYLNPVNPQDYFTTAIQAPLGTDV